MSFLRHQKYGPAGGRFRTTLCSGRRKRFSGLIEEEENTNFKTNFNQIQPSRVSR